MLGVGWGGRSVWLIGRGLLGCAASAHAVVYGEPGCAAIHELMWWLPEDQASRVRRECWRGGTCARPYLRPRRRRLQFPRRLPATGRRYQHPGWQAVGDW